MSDINELQTLNNELNDPHFIKRLDKIRDALDTSINISKEWRDVANGIIDNLEEATIKEYKKQKGREINNSDGGFWVALDEICKDATEELNLKIDANIAEIESLKHTIGLIEKQISEPSSPIEQKPNESFFEVLKAKSQETNGSKEFNTVNEIILQSQMRQNELTEVNNKPISCENLTWYIITAGDDQFQELMDTIESAGNASFSNITKGIKEKTKTSLDILLKENTLDNRTTPNKSALEQYSQVANKQFPASSKNSLQPEKTKDNGPVKA